jgi:hypothetical protein
MKLPRLFTFADAQRALAARRARVARCCGVHAAKEAERFLAEGLREVNRGVRLPVEITCEEFAAGPRRHTSLKTSNLNASRMARM